MQSFIQLFFRNVSSVDSNTTSISCVTVFRTCTSVHVELVAGTKGRLVDLIDPTEKKWEAALACAAGRHMDTVIADTAETVKACIQVRFRLVPRFVCVCIACGFFHASCLHDIIYSTCTPIANRQ